MARHYKMARRYKLVPLHTKANGLSSRVSERRKVAEHMRVAECTEPEMARRTMVQACMLVRECTLVVACTVVVYRVAALSSAEDRPATASWVQRPAPRTPLAERLAQG